LSVRALLPSLAGYIKNGTTKRGCCIKISRGGGGGDDWR